MKKTVSNLLRNMSPTLFLSMTALIVIGALFIYSACSLREDASLQKLHLQHLMMGAVGLFVYFASASANYRSLFRWRWFFYAATLALLVLVLAIGSSRMGAKRWLFGIQPSELAKLAVIIVLARLYGRPGARRGIGTFLLTLLIAGVPAVLVLLQPDLGTALVIVPTIFAMLFAAKVAPRAVWGFAGTAVLAASVVLGLLLYADRPDVTPEKRAKIIRMTGLRPHQVRRLQVFLFPDRDLHGSGYNRWQSEIAVGSGGAWGKGFGKGEQYSLGYLPPSISTNDFIFSVLAEEAGFAGSLMVLLLFLGLLWSGTGVAFRCQDDTGRLYCVGVMALVFSHTFVNIAMTIGVMPITGLPLPFISYGRTFLLTLMVALGLVQSVSVYGQEPEERF
ncbi:MAG: rod shape-determining protein RodA [Kiritimatiellae bacterium]|nr:rod shape-determining protein RodA [Kiritimatiellia bacterium]